MQPAHLQVFSSEKRLPRSIEKIEAVKDALFELFYIRHPQFRKGSGEPKKELEVFIQRNLTKSVWAYLPWRNCAVHIPNEALYTEVRTARNRNLITAKEQANLRKARIGIAGLSVGSSVSLNLALIGGPHYYKLADHDTLEISNLNRIVGSVSEIGKSKVDIAAQNIWELDPFAKIELWKDGITKENLRTFIGNPRLTIFIDEMDNLELKALAREECKKKRIPLLMATDAGNSTILDVERYDKEPRYRIFHGRVQFPKKLPARQENMRLWNSLASQIIGPEFMEKELQSSLMNIGKEISGVPQIGSSAIMAGSILTIAARRIVNGDPLPSGKYIVSPTSILDSTYNSVKTKNERKRIHSLFLKSIQI